MTKKDEKKEIALSYIDLALNSLEKLQSLNLEIPIENDGDIIFMDLTDQLLYLYRLKIILIENINNTIKQYNV